MKTRTLIVGVALWLGVVAVGSGITWLVIEQVGRGVVTSQESDTDPVAGASAPSASPTAATPTSASRPERSATAQSSPGTGDTPTPASSATPRAPSPRTPVAKPPRTTPPSTPRTVSRTWSGTGGHLTVSCTGARAALGSASPDDGWRVEVGSRGPEEVEVEFKQGEEGAESQVKARCSAGAPRFAVEKDD